MTEEIEIYINELRRRKAISAGSPQDMEKQHKTSQLLLKTLTLKLNVKS